MSFSLGENLKFTVKGASHSEYIEVEAEGFPKGFSVDMDELYAFLKRRQGGNSPFATPRKEADIPEFISGMDGNVLNGETFKARFKNGNVRKNDYDNVKYVPRPSHADYVSFVKYDGKLDMSGGGFFSGRMTLPVCLIGGILKQILAKEGINIGTHVYSIGDIKDREFDPVSEEIEPVIEGGIGVLDASSGEEMIKLLTKVHEDLDSIGAVIECKVTGVYTGIGDPIYDSLESTISYAMFGIPAVKGIEFGKGFDITKMRGSEANDPFVIEDGRVRCETNNSGGIQGGISNGMPIVFRVAVKPTPSIGKPQKSVDLMTLEEVDLEIKGRHDCCIALRVLPCVEAMCAIALYNEINR